jgi:hypothetical protein
MEAWQINKTANIPISRLQMDPDFHEPSHNNGVSTPASQYASHPQIPNPFASAAHFVLQAASDMTMLSNSE